jgi:hypothetical protein
MAALSALLPSSGVLPFMARLELLLKDETGALDQLWLARAVLPQVDAISAEEAGRRMALRWFRLVQRALQRQAVLLGLAGAAIWPTRPGLCGCPAGAGRRLFLLSEAGGRRAYSPHAARAPCQRLWPGQAGGPSQVKDAAGCLA